MNTEITKNQNKEKEKTRSILLYLPISLHKKITISATIDYNYTTLPETIINRLKQSFEDHPINYKELEEKLNN